MYKHDHLPRFDWKQLPQEIREANKEIDIFDFRQRELFLDETRIEQIELEIGDQLDLARRLFKEEEDSNVKDQLKRYQNRLGYVLFDGIVPIILETKKKPMAALNLLEIYRMNCWFFEDAPKLQAAFEECETKCFKSLEQQMIVDLQIAHKGLAREQKFERLVRILKGECENYNFPNFMREFTKRVERKPEDVKLLLLNDDYELWGFILNEMYRILELRNRPDVVTKIKETSEADIVMQMAA